MLLVKLIIKRVGFVALALVMFSCVSAQENSPFSRYGLGDLYPQAPIATRSMGGLTAAYADGQALNTVNPASYGAISSTVNGGLVTFDLGISIDARTLTSKDPVNQYRSTNFMPSYVTVGMPLNKKHLGFVFGLKPITRINYSVGSIQKRTFESGFADSMQTLYEGTGGLNQAFIGLGKKWKNLSLGVNAGYAFGRKETSTKINFLNDTVLYNQSNSVNKMNFGGIIFSAGLQYDIKLSSKPNAVNAKVKDITTLRLGANGSWQQNLNLSSEDLNETFVYNADGAVIPVDTISYKQNASGKIQLPSTYDAGFMIIKTVGAAAKWTLGAQYSAGNWGKDYRVYNQPDRLVDNWMFRAGGQITPDVVSATGFFQSAIYRAGFFTGRDYVNADGNQLKVTGFTSGLGFYLSKFNSYDKQYTMINTAIEIGKRGSNVNNVTENYFKFSVGLSLSDIWFIKRKYD